MSRWDLFKDGVREGWGKPFGLVEFAFVVVVVYLFLLLFMVLYR